MKGIKHAESLTMASFDVENLFTNIPLAETINILMCKLFPDNVPDILGIPKKFFKQLLDLSVLNSYFIFNKKFYKQIDGVGMGLPLGPTLANSFLCYHEQTWLQDCPLDFRPVFYRRYVDDTFLLFKDRSHVDLFLSYLNSKHQNIKFTSEIEENNSLSFLDCKIQRVDKRFECSVFRKASFTGLGTSFYSFCSFNFKLNGIKTLIYRAYNICTSYQLLHTEFKFLTKFFCNNGFCSSLVDDQVKKFLDAKFNTPDDNNLNPVNLVFYFSLPFLDQSLKK